MSFLRGQKGTVRENGGAPNQANIREHSVPGPRMSLYRLNEFQKSPMMELHGRHDFGVLE